MNTPDYVVRPKITVVKSKTRATDPAETRIDRDESNQFQSRETEGEGSSGSSGKSDDQFVKERNSAARSFSKMSGSNGVDSSKMSMQRGHFGGINDASSAVPSSNILPKPGVDYWSGSSAGQVAGAEPSTLLSTPGPLPPPTLNYHMHRAGGSAEYWVQIAPRREDNKPKDEKEVKRQKRKEANRESARRSRMRKQAECDELTERVDALTSENNALRAEVDRLTDLCNKFSAENAALLERLGK